MRRTEHCTVGVVEILRLRRSGIGVVIIMIGVTAGGAGLE